jgi:hypothetical protein
VFRFSSTGVVFNLSGFLCLFLIVACLVGILSQSSVIAAQPSATDLINKYDQIFGTPEDFLAKFQKEALNNLNQYVGIGISISGFMLVIRSMFRD